MPGRLRDPRAVQRDGGSPPRAADELARVLFAQGGLLWLSGRSLLFLVLLLGWLAVR